MDDKVPVLGKFLGVIALAFFGWIGLAFYFPHVKVVEPGTPQNQATLNKARSTVVRVLLERLALPQRSVTGTTDELFLTLQDIVLGQPDTAGQKSEPHEDNEFRRSVRDASERAAASTVLRIEPRGGDNLVINMRKSDFESVVYPDRGKFVGAVGKAWCDNTLEGSDDFHFFLPSVYITDIRTGQELASYSCAFDHVSW